MTKEREALKLALEMVQNKMYAHAEMYLKEALMSFQDGAQPEQPDLDAICQDLQEKTYNQAMRIAELEAQLAQPAVPQGHKQEPDERSYAYDMVDRFLRNNLDDEDYANLSANLEIVWNAPQPKEPEKNKCENCGEFGECCQQKPPTALRNKTWQHKQKH